MRMGRIDLRPLYGTGCKLVIFVGVLCLTTSLSMAQKLKVGVFNVDATPPIGSPAAYATTIKIVDSLSAKGIVVLSDQKPIVMCVVDWLGIGNGGQDVWRAALAEAANTTIDRVAIHAIHQHDGARCDFTASKILGEYGRAEVHFDDKFLRQVVANVAAAEKVASNRRVMGDDGKVRLIRWSSARDSAAINAPEGLIDPWLKCVSFWNKNKPLVVMSYYATHPQTLANYGRGEVTSEFIGLAREARQKELGFPHIHFNGAGGNITTGKYNNGSMEAAIALKERMITAHKQAWESTKKIPVSTKDLGWKSTEIQLPFGAHLVEKDLRAIVANEKESRVERFKSADHLAWLKRQEENKKVPVSALRLGKVWLLNLPGEPFIEYQLAAQKMKPVGQVCTAGYGEYGPSYICTEVAYSQGGYEINPFINRLAPSSEHVLMKAIEDVLK
jgi:hypothetical protein